MTKHFYLTLLIIFSTLVNAQVKVKMTPENGVYTMPCAVNGLKLKFVFDTGASSVCISLTEAYFMLKNGYLNESDINGSSYSQIANGEVVKNTTVKLRVIEISGIKIYDVDAIIIHELSAPLLLGQSAIQKLGKIQINGEELIIINSISNLNSILKNDVDSMSYCLGLNVGSDFSKNIKGIPGGKANIDFLVMGFSTGIKEKKGLISNDLANVYFKKYIEKASSGFKSKNRNEKGYSILTNDVDSMSYCLGINIGTDFSKNIKGIPGGKANLDMLINAFSSAMKEESTLIDTAFSKTYFKKYIEKAQSEDDALKKTIGENFLTENKTKKGIITTPSGLQYQVLISKKGLKPLETDNVKVHYQGFLLDGTKFDSSIDRGEPIIFPLNQVIPGWTEGLQLMSVGSKYKFFVPYTLGYGEKGAGNGAIPGFSTLIFEVELLEIKHN
jgi:clan AA aspartic protease (TIGR02281 family)